MSLRLRILLLVATINVVVLLLVVWFGLRSVEREGLIGPEALLEAFRLVEAEDKETVTRFATTFLVLGKAQPGEPMTFAISTPPEFASEAERVEKELLERAEAGDFFSSVSRAGITVVSGEAPGMVRRAWHVGFNARAGRGALQSLRTLFLLLCAGALVLVGATYFVLRRLVLRPVERLAAASSAVAEGRRAEPVEVPTGRDEMARLVTAFNHMAREVHDYQQHLEERVGEALQRVRAAENRLVVAQRVASTGTLAAGFAHEINNPLGGIVNALRRLREGQLAPDRRSEYFDLVEDGFERIRTIVQRILHFTPRQREPLTVDTAEVCRRAAALAQHRADAQGVAIDCQVAPGPGPGVVGDEQELTQAVLNLVLNAIDATSAGVGGQVSLSAQVNGADVVLAVRDDGPGMDEETAQRCVDFFFSTKPEGEGTGLGLAIVQHIATDHGGSLGIESRPGMGTTVTIRLPQAGLDVTAS